MRILQVVPYFWPALSFGGPAKVVYELSRELAERNKITVYTSDTWDQKRRIRRSEKTKNSRKFKVIYFRNLINSIAFNWRVFTNFGIVAEYQKHKNDFDIVHINDVFSLPQITLAAIARHYSKPYVVSTHGVEIVNPKKKGSLKSLLYTIFVKKMLYSAQAVVATSQAEAAILQKMGLKNVHIVFNGVSMHKTTASNKFEKYSKKKGIQILYIGRINALKGLDSLLLALRGIDIPYRLLIAGPDDGDKGRLISLTNKYEIKKNIHFLGFVNEAEKQELYNISDIFIYPSKLEGFSISILEAMRQGLPVLITKACNFPDVEKFDAGVILSQPQLSKEIIEKLVFLNKNEHALKKMGNNAKKLVQRKYSIGAMADSVQKIYKKYI